MSKDDIDNLSYRLFSLQQEIKRLETEKKKLIEKIKYYMLEHGMDTFDDSYGNTIKEIRKKYTSLDREGLREYLGENVYNSFVQEKYMDVLVPYSKDAKKNTKKFMRYQNGGS